MLVYGLGKKGMAAMDIKSPVLMEIVYFFQLLDLEEGLRGMTEV